MRRMRVTLDMLPDESNSKKVMEVFFRHAGKKLREPGMPLEEAVRAVEELWTKGYIRFEFSPKDEVFEIVPCTPDEAPQLRSPFAFADN